MCALGHHQKSVCARDQCIQCAGARPTKNSALSLSYTGGSYPRRLRDFVF